MLRSADSRATRYRTISRTPSDSAAPIATRTHTNQNGVLIVTSTSSGSPWISRVPAYRPGSSGGSTTRTLSSLPGIERATIPHAGSGFASSGGASAGRTVTWYRPISGAGVSAGNTSTGDIRPTIGAFVMVLAHFVARSPSGRCGASDLIRSRYTAGVEPKSVRLARYVATRANPSPASRRNTWSPGATSIDVASSPVAGSTSRSGTASSPSAYAADTAICTCSFAPAAAGAAP